MHTKEDIFWPNSLPWLPPQPHILTKPPRFLTQGLRITSHLISTTYPTTKPTPIHSLSPLEMVINFQSPILVISNTEWHILTKPPRFLTQGLQITSHLISTTYLTTKPTLIHSLSPLEMVINFRSPILVISNTEPPLIFFIFVKFCMYHQWNQIFFLYNDSAVIMYVLFTLMLIVFRSKIFL